ncbi:MAG: ADP-ribosylglycohydrolase family protein [Thermomicrobiales bacterium]|nr:ADP-ribosylglycohydrolase family protein [Thermomicrobiales bacterium]
MDQDQQRNRFRGVMLGKAVGDALGATVEFKSPEAIAATIGVHREIVGGGWLHLPAGEVTDDTQMALCIARSIVEQQRFDPDDIAARFVEWYRSDPKDIGNTTRHALQLLDSGVSWQEAGARTHEAMRPRDASNGSIMRCAPVALMTWRDAEQNASFSADSSRITHANPLCVDACVALNAAVASLLLGETDPIAAADNAASLDEVREVILAAATATPGALRAGGYVLDTLGAALWAVTNHDTPEDAIVAAVNLGNDADTTGAVAGALAGARWGAEALPSRWVDALLGGEELVALADALIDLS